MVNNQSIFGLVLGLWGVLQIVLFEEVSLCLNDRAQKLFLFFTHVVKQDLLTNPKSKSKVQVQV